MFIPHLVQGWGVVWAGGQGIVATGTQVAVQLQEIWAASEAVFSHDLSVPDLALSCGVECAERQGILTGR